MMVDDGAVQTPPAKALWQVYRNAFTEILKNEAGDNLERNAAVLSLPSIDSDAQELTPIILAMAQGRIKFVHREHALQALGYIGADPQVVVPVLLQGLGGRQYARIMSAQGLGGLGPQAKDALPELRAALKDVDPVVRTDAAGAIWKIEKQASAVVLLFTEALAGGEDPGATTARQRAVYYLRQIGPEAKDASPTLLKLWHHEANDYSRKDLATALKAIDNVAAAKAGVR
jgi:HEAT repeat protein